MVHKKLGLGGKSGGAKLHWEYGEVLVVEGVVVVEAEVALTVSFLLILLFAGESSTFFFGLRGMADSLCFV